MSDPAGIPISPEQTGSIHGPYINGCKLAFEGAQEALIGHGLCVACEPV